MIWIAAAIMIAAIGWVDFFSGVELRVFPLYYLPISLLAWQVGRSGALIAAGLSAVVWLGGNWLAGLEYSSPALWIVNTLVLAVSFAFVGVLISTLKDALSRERALSRTDPLTALLNSRAFFEQGGRIRALCERKRHPLTLAYVDLDNFKKVNDALGHQAGDNVLRSVARALRASTRPSDLCARLGGDEFVVLLPEVDAGEARVALERLQAVLATTTSAKTGSVTCSIGAVTYDAVPRDLEEMVRFADSRMYLAKAAGKDRLHLETMDGD